jgi:hypothetical protein
MAFAPLRPVFHLQDPVARAARGSQVHSDS